MRPNVHTHTRSKIKARNEKWILEKWEKWWKEQRQKVGQMYALSTAGDIARATAEQPQG